MPGHNNQNGTKSSLPSEGITRITVGGYKSIAQEQSIEIRPLTILAGANSSGKSSIMQPLLLLKQTLESSYEPEALLLAGPNVHATSTNQILTKTAKDSSPGLLIGIEVDGTVGLTTFYLGKGLKLDRMTRQDNSGRSDYIPDIKSDQPSSDMPNQLRKFLASMNFGADTHPEWQVRRDRCFLKIDVTIRRQDGSTVAKFELKPTSDVEPYILEIIHLPGLRSKPIRVYPTTSIGPTFPGTFDGYTASIIAHWQVTELYDRLSLLRLQMIALGLSGTVTSEFPNDTEVVLKVGRTLQSDALDVVKYR